MMATENTNLQRQRSNCQVMLINEIRGRDLRFHSSTNPERPFLAANERYDWFVSAAANLNCEVAPLSLQEERDCHTPRPFGSVVSDGIVDLSMPWCWLRFNFRNWTVGREEVWIIVLNCREFIFNGARHGIWHEDTNSVTPQGRNRQDFVTFLISERALDVSVRLEIWRFAL
jgi:hypothetical protein